MKLKFCVLILLSASIATYVWVIELKTVIKARSFDEGSMCPARMAVSMDLGRIGNKFFEYMATRVISEVLGIETFITSEFGLLYDRYFNGRRTPIVDWTYLLNKCGIIESNCETLSIDYSPTRLLPKGIRHECVKFQGNTFAK
jgi:hypothetical protein